VGLGLAFTVAEETDRAGLSVLVDRVEGVVVSGGRAEGALAGCGATIRVMNAPGTATVEIDLELLERLRKRRPEQSDRELVERVARIELGFEAIHRAQERTAAAGTDQAEIDAEAVRAVKESRSEQAA
jgi:hypothetical protein